MSKARFQQFLIGFFCIAAVYLLIAFSIQEISGVPVVHKPVVHSDPLASASLYEEITLGMSPSQVEEIAGRPQKVVEAGAPFFQLMEYPQGSEIVEVQVDQINDDHSWRVSDVCLHADVSPSNPNGNLSRVKYGPIPPSCSSCSR